MRKTLSIHSIPPFALVAHRGYKTRYPENTIAAFRAALAAKAEMIELDVGLSRDRIPVVIHDDTLERTTNGNGPVSSFALSELQTLDAGSWFSPKFSNERIPTLEAVLALAAGKTRINIEIKPEAVEDPPCSDSIEYQVISLLKRFNCIDSVIVSSFELKCIERIIALMGSRLATAYLTEGPLSPQVFDRILALPIFSWNPDWESVTRDQVERMHAKGIRVFTYTVNDATIAKSLFDMGVDGIFSDDVYLLTSK